MIFLIAFLFWFYHVPGLQGLEEDEIDNSRMLVQHREEVSFNSGKDSFIRLQQKYEHQR